MNLLEPSDMITSVDLRRKLLFSVSQKLILRRSCELVPPEPDPPFDPWNIRALDFSPKLYTSKGLPQIKAKSMYRLKSEDSVDEKPFVLEKINDVFPKPGEKKHNNPPFITKSKPPDSLETKLLFVRAGMYPPGPYEDPKRHNFRPCSDGLPNMVTFLEKNPVCLASRSLTEVTDIRPEKITSDSLIKMNTFKPAELKWDPKLLLPKSPWPPKSASYTRHRRRRGAYSALLERVEDKLKTNSWRK